jgi:hypothetical protein
MFGGFAYYGVSVPGSLKRMMLEAGSIFLAQSGFKK